MIQIKRIRDWNKFESCCDCRKDIEIKYNRGTKTWSVKNNVGNWTGKLRDRNKYRCDNCWLLLYYKMPQDFVALVPSDRDRNKFLSYINGGWFGELEKTENKN